MVLLGFLAIVSGDAGEPVCGRWILADPRVEPVVGEGVVAVWRATAPEGLARFELRRCPHGDRDAGERAASLLPMWPRNASVEAYRSMDRAVPAPGCWRYTVVAVFVDGTREERELGLADWTGPIPLSGPDPAGPDPTTAGGADVSVGDVVEPVFVAEGFSTRAPVQCGSARRGLVREAGLYRAPAGNPPVHNLGVRLPWVGESGVFFARPVRDFYTVENALWAGDLRFSGSAGTIPPPQVQARLLADGRVRGVFRAEENLGYHANTYKPPAPNWYWQRLNIDGDSATVTVEVPEPRTTGPAVLRIALNADSVTGESNALSAWVNGTAVMADTVWQDPGYRVVSVGLDPGVLVSGENTVAIAVDRGLDRPSVKYLDWIELEVDAAAVLRNGSLVLETDPGVERGTVTVPGATRCADVTVFGGETGVVLDNGTAGGLAGGRLFFFTDRVREPDWSEPQELKDVPEARPDYVAVAADREFLSALLPLVEYHRSRGLSVLAVEQQTVHDVYGGGLYGPAGILGLVDRLEPRFLFLAGGTNRDYNLVRPDTVPRPWIPSGWQQVFQWTPTDDIYSREHRTAVGRVPVHTAEDLSAWVAKRLAYKPPDRAVFTAGDTDPGFDFHAAQARNQGLVPSALVTCPSRAIAAVRRDLQAAVSGQGMTLVAYQGHAGIHYLNKRDRQLVGVGDANLFPPTAWLMATCNVGLYQFDEETLLRRFLAAPGTGAVSMLAATTVGEAEVEDWIVQEWSRLADTVPGLTWGGVLNIVKAARSGNDTVRVYSYFGDPAMPVLAGQGRRTVVCRSPAAGAYAPVSADGTAGTANLELGGDWSAGSSSVPELGMQFRAGTGPWSELPAGTAITTAVGGERFLHWPIPTDGGGLPVHGGFGELRLVSSDDGILTEWERSGPFRLDTRAPRIVLDPVPEPVPVPVLELSAAGADPDSGIAGWAFVLERDTDAGGLWRVESGELTGPEYSFERLVPAVYRATVQAVDAAGNLGSAVADVTVAFEDRDRDALPDRWELDRFGDVGFAAADTDADGDGVDDFGEYALGLDPYDFVLELGEGACLIPVPCPLPAEVIGDLESRVLGSIWLWNGEGYRAGTVRDLKPGTAGWVFVDQGRATTYTFSGTPETRASVPKADGWQLFVPARTVVRPDAAVFPTVVTILKPSVHIAVGDAGTLSPRQAAWYYRLGDRRREGQPRTEGGDE